ncbi:sulfate transporter CysZ [Porticoccaceae bacterium]|nr:sulfate transporter CysZ [Porticoccaceae bacterium]
MVNNSLGSAVSGPSLILQGAKLLWHPSIRWLVLIPLLINILLFSALTAAAGQWLGGWLDSMVNAVPDWLQWLVWIVWLLFSLLALVIYAFSFTLVANLIGSPFYGLIAERVIIMQGASSAAAESSVFRVAWQSFRRQLQLLAYFIPRTIAVGLLTLLVSFVPLINLLAPVIAGCWAAWSLAIQYLDYPADTEAVSFNQLIDQAGQNRWPAMGFGFAALGASAIPLLNLVALPAAVVGGTLLWCRTYKSTDS